MSSLEDLLLSFIYFLCLYLENMIKFYTLFNLLIDLIVFNIV